MSKKRPETYVIFGIDDLNHIGIVPEDKTTRPWLTACGKDIKSVPHFHEESMKRDWCQDCLSKRP